MAKYEVIEKESRREPSKYCVPAQDIAESELHYIVELTMDNNTIHRADYHTTATKILEFAYMVDCLVKGATLNVYQHIYGIRTSQSVAQNVEEVGTMSQM